jgi:hypothetical protein
MGYLEDYNLLKDIYSLSNDSIKIPDTKIEIKNYSFVSDENGYYPDSDYYNNCINKNLSIINNTFPNTESILGKNDDDETCNKRFIYPLYHDSRKIKKLIILIHGLNESSWDKYNPWAKRLVELTGQAVLMFPISFHVNRKPQAWSASRSMNVLSKERKNNYESKESSFVNAALSTRLQFNPELFFWSGLRSFYDVQKLIEEIRNGSISEIDKDCRISFFGYSIGAFLIENLIMARKELFSDSKIVLFCGGPTMDIMYPISKYIYDSTAERVMTDFYVKNFERNIQSDEYLKKYFADNEEDGMVFRSLLNMDRHSGFRVNKLKDYEDRILAIPLTCDYVMPPDSVRKTLNENGLKVRINEMNFPFDYDHISPFPLGEKIKEETNECFGKVLANAAEWLD